MATLYPTWNRFIKMWKTIVYPVIKQNINVYDWYQPSNDEEYDVTTRDVIDASTIESILDNLRDALIAKGYSLHPKDSGLYDCDITIQGKERWAPEIGISISLYELSDDEILYGWDDSRWAEWNKPQDEFGFKLSYSKWIKEHGIKDTYDNILKAPKKVQKSYCDWERSTDYNHLWVTIIYAE